MWKAVETKAGKIRVAEIEKRGSKGGSRKKVRRKGKGKGKGKEEKTEKTKEEKNSRYKKDGRRMRDMGGGGRSSEVRGRG